MHYYFRRLHRVEKLAEQGETLPDQKAKTHICVYIEGFYNNSRRNSSSGYLSYNEYQRFYYLSS